MSSCCLYKIWLCLIASCNSCYSWSLAFCSKAKDKAIACSSYNLYLSFSSIWSWTLSSVLAYNSKICTFFSDFFQSLRLKFFILRYHDSFEHFKVIANKNLSEDFSVFLRLKSSNNTFFQSLLCDSSFLDNTLDKDGTYWNELLEDFSILELVLLSIFKDSTVLLDKVHQWISPNGWDEILLDEVINPFFFFRESLVRRFLFFILFGSSEKPIEHFF